MLVLVSTDALGSMARLLLGALLYTTIDLAIEPQQSVSSIRIMHQLN